MASVSGMDRRTVRIDGLGNKLCTGCSVWKPLDAFHVRAASPDGRHGFCKNCRSSGKKLTALDDPIGFKTCRKCLVRKLVDEFNLCAGNSDGRQSYCKPCNNASTAARRDWTLRTKYGIGSTEYDALLTKQDGKCAICGTTKPKTKGGEYFVVDHCHSTGKVRGLLCVPCNLALGYVQDDPAILRSAITYLSSADLF